MISKIKKKLYPISGANIKHFLNCIGVKDTSSIDVIAEQFRGSQKVEYIRFITMLRSLGTSEVGTLVNNFEFLNSTLSKAFLGNDSVDIVIRNMFASGEEISVNELKELVKMVDTAKLTPVRTIDKYYFSARGTLLPNDSPVGVKAFRVAKDDLPLKGIKQMILTENVSILSNNSIYSSNIDFSKESAICFSSPRELEKIVSKYNRKSKNQVVESRNATIIEALDYLVSKSIIAPMDILIPSSELNGEIIRGNLNVKFKLNGYTYNVSLTASDLIKTISKAKIYKSPEKINTPVGKRSVFLIYEV